jgi:DNA-3-methyladenine glycosylase
MSVVIKRVYDEAAPDDGYRVLVDRLWPRGVSKERAKLDVWLKEVAPSQELREWFGHKPERFKEFKSRYEKELRDNPAVEELRTIIKEHPKVTLLYGAHDPKDNQAVVLRDFLS